MTTVAIEKEIAKYAHKLDLQQKETVLTVVKTFAGIKKDWWDELNDEQIAAIKEAEAELDAGKGIPHAQVSEKAKQVALSVINFSQKEVKRGNAARITNAGQGELKY